MSASVESPTCDSCGHVMRGYTKVELGKEHGWMWHADNGVTFVMCGECESVYAQRRMERALRAVA